MIKIIALVLFCLPCFAADRLPVIWNSLNSGKQITNSIIGVSGIINGTLTYSSARYDNGAGGGTTIANWGRWTQPLTVAQINSAFTIEGWWIPAYASDYNFGSGSPMCIFSLSDTGTYETPLAVYHGLSTKIGIMTVYSTPYPGATGPVYDFTPSAFSAGDKIHIAAIKDYSAGAGHKVRLFVNGVELTPTVVSDNDRTYTAGYVHYLYTGWPPNGWNMRSGSVDNLKIWNYVKTEFADRNIYKPLRMR